MATQPTDTVRLADAIDRLAAILAERDRRQAEAARCGFETDGRCFVHGHYCQGKANAKTGAKR